MPRLRMSGGIALCAFMAWQDSFTFCLWGDWMDHYEYLCLLPDLVPLDTTIMVHYVLECNCLIVAESRQQTKICAVSAMLFCALWYAPRMMCHIKLPYQTLWQQNSMVQTPSIWMPASRQKREPAYLANANPCIPPPNNFAEDNPLYYFSPVHDVRPVRRLPTAWTVRGSNPVGDCLVCRSLRTGIPGSQLHRVIYTRWCIDTIDSPDDEHWVARNV